MTRELSEQAKAMVERALADEKPLLPGASRRAQLKRGLLQGAALAAATPAAAAPLAAPAAAAKGALGVVSLGPLAKGVVLGLLVSGGLLGGVQVFGTAPTRSSAPVVVASAAAPAAVAVPNPLVSPALVASAGPNRAENRASAVTTPPGRPSSSEAAPLAEAPPGLSAELQLLNAAQSALRDGRGAQALALLQRYDQAFPQGQLLGERLAAEVFAACQIGERGRASGAAERFLQQDASSVLAGRVRRSCAFQQKGSEP